MRDNASRDLHHRESNASLSRFASFPFVRQSLSNARYRVGFPYCFPFLREIWQMGRKGGEKEKEEKSWKRIET